jgi:competence protein ComEA
MIVRSIVMRFLATALFVVTAATVFVPLSRAAAAGESQALVNLNTATDKELEGLKGVGPAIAKKIVAGRPYQSVDGLAKAGVSAKVIEEIRAFVTVGQPAPAAAATKTAAKPAVTLVDINAADLKTLETLPGIDAALAQKIIDGRPYKKAADLKKVQGLDKTKIKAITKLVSFKAAAKSGAATAASQPAAAAAPAGVPAQSPAKSAATTTTAAPAATQTTAGTGASRAASTAKLAPGQIVNINTATLETLEALPEIGPVKAQAIIDGRPYQTIEDVMKVKGIKTGIFAKIKDSIAVK